MPGTAKKTTLLDLLSKLQADKATSERALVARAIRAVRSGRVALVGIFAGTQTLK